MSMPRRAAALAVLVIVVLAGPAAAHEEISPVTVPTGKAVFLTLLAANETGSALTRITLTAPAGVELGGATRQPTGWTAQRSPTAVTWSGGSLAPGNFEEWGFEIEAVAQPGALRFRVVSSYAGGGDETHTVAIDAVAAGTSTPTPTVTVTTAPAEAPATTVAEPAGDDGSGLDAVALGLGGVALVLALVALAVALRSGGASEERDW